MRTSLTAVVLASLAAVLVLGAGRVQAKPIEAKYQKAINDGLNYLKKNQHKDGHWEAAGGQYPHAMTGLAGMALLMEGSTIREGKYSDCIRRAVDWMLSEGHVQKNGLLCNPNVPGERDRYMYGHGFGLLFLASVYGEEEDSTKRAKLERVLTKAAEFTYKAQTSRGGWGYVSATDGQGFDEGSVTVTQLQAIRACRNAGIAVPKECIKKAVKYLKDATNGQGGVIYSLAGGFGGDGRPSLTAAAVCCGFSAGEYNSDTVKKWIKFCASQPGLTEGGGGNRFGHDEYTHYYWAQCRYAMGEKAYKKLFPKAGKDEVLLWSSYRKKTFENLLSTQNKSDGSWGGGYVGNIYSTAINLAILQLDKAMLPIYQR